MDLSKLSNDLLLGRTEGLCRSERKITHLILWHINEIEFRSSYAGLGYSSMFKFLTQYLGYGEGAAWERLHASRLLRKIPQLQEKIESGSLNLTQMAHVQKCLNIQAREGNAVGIKETVQVLEKIEELNGFDTKKVLAVEFNLPIQQHEVVKPQRDESVRLELTLSDDQMARLRQTRDMLSHVLPEATWADVIDYLTIKHIQKVNGKEKTVEEANVESFASNEVQLNRMAKELVARTLEAMNEKMPGISKAKLTDKNSGSVIMPRFSATEKSRRKNIKITTRRDLLNRASQCCEFIDARSGTRCNGTYQLQIDHKIPLALGGSNKVSNLRVLCRTHNLFAAKQFGLIR